MLSVNTEDLLAVLQLLTPYFIALGAVLVCVLVVVIAARRATAPRRKLTRSLTGLGALAATAVVLSMVATGPMAALIDLSTSSGEVTQATTDEARTVAQAIAEEGVVLLENDDNLLPLASGTALNVFGWSSTNPVYGGAGSGGLNDLYERVTLLDGLRQAGFTVNEQLADFYNDYSAQREEVTIERQSWSLTEPPVAEYPAELITAAQKVSGTAVVVVSRLAGEGHNDMPVDMTQAVYDNNSNEYDDFDPGEHYLQLSRTERDLVEMVTSTFDNVIVVYNGNNPMELGFVEDYEQIKAALWVPGPGDVGFSAVGQILSGEVNPSGHTTDTFLYSMTSSPAWHNQVSTHYSNLEHLAVEGMNAGAAQTFYPSFTNYVEGVYVGYRYYETAAVEGVIDYDTTVQYPFGHGLSYTTFTQETGEVTEADDGTLSLEVTVTNTGDMAGKDAVEVYSSPPYTNGGIEKPSAVLVAFAKTATIQPGASQTLTISFSREDLASYDTTASGGAGGYILEAGDYVLNVNADSHTVLDSATWTLAQTQSFTDVARTSDQMVAMNQLADAAGDVTYLSRADSFANLPEATAAPTRTELEEPWLSNYHLNATFDYTTYQDPGAPMPTTGADGELILADLRGADYDDERWDALLDQATIDEMIHMISLSGYQTPAMDSVGKVQAIDSDGPAAINNNFTGVGSIGMPVEVMIANTWNVELGSQYGRIMGKMAKEMGSAGWYAPGMNIHRIALGARNYEYFSEDPLLSGTMSAAAVAGARQEGVYSFVKHFALYDFNGKMVSVWSNEQAIREIYLRPFEIAVKDGGANAVMVSWSFVGARWAGEVPELMNTILRDEWGFRGMALTDFFRNNGHGFMNADAALANGVDAMLSTFEGGPNRVTNPDDPATVANLRRATKNVLYVVASSWLYDESEDVSRAAPWRTYLYVADVIVAVSVLALGGFAVARYRRRTAAPDGS
ncbi:MULTISPECIES: glycoside hydrolase family 3 C-terminal domain-containing protein [unclassified Actinomyces]|uniref:glycoside hydrolase family 3 C-terminal domain-containing protein n=1 Tax=unclassified Actinomyces TaxID=2609248 RepID=UPI0020175EEF|nr:MULTISPECIES: glycoside hydrolase family 3 C-terminal domain-containing protein [unclassified Actinomyces]MCL3778200.1 glycoside hydrolase family 3 C-terminal domain-containing protein [Actinomyces sp. AC-20-1]MCL3788903.1 glycoside hydrolase family 3 C-terminal domain-containing protein [Actinomyces sp. 187325]MCL3792197.1 glycoside hydrolase family 3 C-terminal domain-containing protein [Actinomyces sp. 186855]MCL3794176.1 glycoside hydrolase family 3 C-terminal domain-containing protein [